MTVDAAIERVGREPLRPSRSRSPRCDASDLRLYVRSARSRRRPHRPQHLLLDQIEQSAPVPAPLFAHRRRGRRRHDEMQIAEHEDVLAAVAPGEAGGAPSNS